MRSGQFPLPLVLNHPAANAFNSGMMREHVNVPVASTKKRTQNPTHYADHNCAPEGTPKTVHMESNDDTRHHEQHQAIQNENEKAQGQQDQRRTEDQ